MHRKQLGMNEKNVVYSVPKSRGIKPEDWGVWYLEVRLLRTRPGALSFSAGRLLFAAPLFIHFRVRFSAQQLVLFRPFIGIGYQNTRFGQFRALSCGGFERLSIPIFGKNFYLADGQGVGADFITAPLYQIIYNGGRCVGDLDVGFDQNTVAGPLFKKVVAEDVK
jgi:hypothetical protein